MGRLAAALVVVAALGAAVASGTFSSPDGPARAGRLALEEHGAGQVATATRRAVKRRGLTRPAAKKPRCRVVRQKVRRHGRLVTKRVTVCRPRPAPSPRRIPPPAPVTPIKLAPIKLAPPPPLGPAPVTDPPADHATPGPTATLADDDGGSSLYAVAGASPGAIVMRCIRVTYANEDDQDAQVRLYATGSAGGLDSLLEVTIEAGTRPAGGSPACTGFVPAGAPIVSSTLAQLLAAHADYAAGVATAPAGKALWEDGDAVAYRISVTLPDDPAANGGASGPLTSGSHAYVWEARDG